MKYSKPVVAAVLLAAACAASAAVTPEEAARLKTTLTPFGAERAGNREGTIPPWTGGYTVVPPGYVNGQPRRDPFAAEKRLFSIDAANAAQHQGKLSEGAMAMLRMYPDYRIDVYPSHRTAAAPQWVYDNTFANATRAHLRDGTLKLEGAYGGIPFPIPKSGVEAMWNRQLAWAGTTVNITFKGWAMTGGDAVLSTRTDFDINQMPYYRKGGTPETWDGTIRQTLAFNQEPPQKAGTGYLIFVTNADTGTPTDAWLYIAGQRRTRKAPSIRYDAPSTLSNGISNHDDLFGFNGEFDRYEWKLLGKREAYVPYNTNALLLQKTSDVLGHNFLNPDHVRWELHRVWVLEGTVLPGKRNVSAKRRLYLDEDTWLPVLAEAYDNAGALWKNWALLPSLAPDIPAVVLYASGVYNLLTGEWGMEALPNEMPVHYMVEDYLPPSAFTPERLNSLGQR